MSRPRAAAQRGFDGARLVVILLVAGALFAIGSIVFATATPARAPGAGADAPVTTEAKVFEGRRFKYHLRTPAGTPWRALPDMLVTQRLPGADFGVERVGSGASIFVVVAPAPPDLTAEKVLESLSGPTQDGTKVEEIARNPVQKGESKGLFVRARKSKDAQSIEMFLLAIPRGENLYLVSAIVESPVRDDLAAELTGILNDFEPPAVGVVPLPPR